MVGVTTQNLDGAAAGAGRPIHGWGRFRWAVLALGLLAAAPPALLAVYWNDLAHLQDWMLLAGFSVVIIAVVSIVVAAGMTRRVLAAIPLALGSAVLLVGAEALARLRAEDAITGVTAATLQFIALAPALAAMWARSRIDLSNPKIARRTVSGASGVAIAQLAALSLIAAYSQSTDKSVAPHLTWIFVIVIALPIMAAMMSAVRERRLPLAYAERPPFGHISSIGVITLTLFVIVIASLGAWSASHGETARISQGTGLAVVVGLIVAFGVVAVGPTSERLNKSFEALSSAIEGWFGWVSKAFSAFDAFLVFAVAPMMGADQPKRTVRYGLLFGHLILIGTLGWWLPPPWGLVPLFFSLVAVVAIARRWAWVEEDRENAMLNRKFSGPQIRIGFANDLRDEALLGFMSLFVIVPLALRQLHLADGGNLFLVSPEASVHDILPWVSFFGAELAKAVPFVDWAEIYQVKGSAPISMDEEHVGNAQHAVFATRVIVDLVFLAALLQALSSLQRSAKLRDMFYKERTIDRLDPFAENAAFHGLAVAVEGGWKLVDDVPEPFWAYDEDRLEELAQREGDGSIQFVARAILDRNAARPPEQLLVDEARQGKPDSQRLEALIGRVRDERPEPSIEPLKLAHLQLNSGSRALGVRLQIVQIVGENWSAPGAVGMLCAIILPGASRDARAEVRLAALQALFQAALLGEDKAAQRTIRWASTRGNDGAIRVLNAASAMIKQRPDWGDEGGSVAPVQ